MKIYILAAALRGLVSCGVQSNICEAPTRAENETLEGCIHRSAYEFARSDGTNTELADATVTQCEALVKQKAERLLEIGVELAHRRGLEGTGAQYLEAREQYLTSVRDDARADALRRVIQAKSGTCEAVD